MTEIEVMKEFGKNLKSILEEYQMTQKELAEITGISESIVSYYIHGQRMPTVKALINLSNALDCDPQELIIFDDKVE